MGAARSPEQPLHIVQCLAALSLGGSELATVELAEGLRAVGHRVTLIARPGALTERCVAAGVNLLPWDIGAKRLRSLAWILRLRRWLRQQAASGQAVDVLHAQARLPAWLAWLAWRGLDPSTRPAWFTTVHGQYSPSRYSRIMASGEGVIAVSQAMARWAARLDPSAASRTQVIYGGIDPQVYFPQFHASADWLQRFDRDWPGVRQRPLISLVARGTRLKNHAALIRLIAALRQRGCDVAGLIVGGFSQRRQHYRDELDALAKQLGVSEHIHFLGDRQDIRELMSISALVVNLSTKAEAFGRTLAEALALGRPVLSWDRGGASEILAQCYSAGAVPADDEAALLERALALLDQAPVPLVVPFQLTRTSAQTLAFYRQVLASKAQDGARTRC